MAASLTTLFNLALREVGSRAKVALPSERSREAEACSFYYPLTRDFIFASAPWTSARQIARLARVATQSDTWTQLGPDPGYQFAFALPIDFIHPYYLDGFHRFELRVIPFISGPMKCLMANVESPILHYTFRNDDPSSWDPQLFMAMGVGLGANICMDLTGKLARWQNLMQRANIMIAEARATNGNSEQSQLDTIAPWHAARGYQQGGDMRFIYPYGPNFGGTFGGSNVD